MKIRKPDYYDRFQCIAGACKDSCCIGWEIDVDDEKRQMYRNVDGELGEQLKKCIDWEEGYFILQGKEERCPFLNSENLCDLIIGLGEESLCDICREHPRYYEWYDGLTEKGVGLCCEAAARLILESEEKVRFVECVEGDNLAEDDTLDVLFSARDTAFAILQNREKSIWYRLKEFLAYIEELQEGLDFENLDEIEESSNYYRNVVMAEPEEIASLSAEEESAAHEEKKSVYRELLDMCRKLEPIDESWPKRLEKIEGCLADDISYKEAEDKMLAAAKDREYEYEHLAVYFVYRYCMKCRTSGDVYSYGCLTVFCILLIRLLDVVKFMENGELTKEDRAVNAKDCSKEIEYSEENLEILANEFWERGWAGVAACL